MLATVEWCYAIFQIKRDLSFMTRFELFTFEHVFMPIARWGFRRLHWPIFEKLDKLKCDQCGFENQVENGGCWTEKQTVVTTRHLAEQVVRDSNGSGSYWHRMPVNAMGSTRTLRTHNDHRFPKSPGAKQYVRLSSDVDEVNRSTVANVHSRGSEVLERLSALNQ